ncbi:SCO4402 family protein [Acinetobacter beijerinckii]|uniref:Uncharacterized protein n=1 Tax=Acinetobacter beijerinckii ANC 3835 TaxID=1217649 RepID=N9E4N5_9GAMM|nr:hypothetical protein [Acinetobacter beijerinckii]ENW05082.1 hypothetical protein F934_01814 [Acinetobacter beijerinckii ANC 3835]
MINHKERRENLIVYLTDLATYPFKFNIKENEKILDMDLDDIIHFFFDDTQLANSTARELGWILESEEEIRIIKELTEILDKILDKYGVYLLDTDYIYKPEWKNIIYTAQKALDIIEKSNLN